MGLDPTLHETAKGKRNIYNLMFSLFYSPPKNLTWLQFVTPVEQQVCGSVFHLVFIIYSISIKTFYLHEL
jgi:hypothetical protein